MRRTLLAWALVSVAWGAAGCNDKPPPTASPSASPAASAAPVAKGSAAPNNRPADDSLRPDGDFWFCGAKRCYRESDVCRGAEGGDCEQSDRASCATSADGEVRCYPSGSRCMDDSDRQALGLSACTDWL